MAKNMELDDCPLKLCLDAVINCLLHDDSFTDVALAIFDKFKCQCLLLNA